MSDKIHMTRYAKASGCAAKIGPGTLAKILGKLPKFENDHVLVGLERIKDHPRLILVPVECLEKFSQDVGTALLAPGAEGLETGQHT